MKPYTVGTGEYLCMLAIVSRLVGIVESAGKVSSGTATRLVAYFVVPLQCLVTCSGCVMMGGVVCR